MPSGASGAEGATYTEGAKKILEKFFGESVWGASENRFPEKDKKFYM